MLLVSPADLQQYMSDNSFVSSELTHYSEAKLMTLFSYAVEDTFILEEFDAFGCSLGATTEPRFHTMFDIEEALSADQIVLFLDEDDDTSTTAPVRVSKQQRRTRAKSRDMERYEAPVREARPAQRHLRALRGTVMKLRHFRPLSFNVIFRPEIGQTRVIKQGLRMGAAMSLAEELMRTGGKAWLDPC